MIKRFLAVVIMALLTLPAVAVDIMRGDNGLYGLMTTEKGKSKWVMKPQFTNMHRNTADTYFVYGTNGKWGLVSSEGEEIVPCKYSSIAVVKDIDRHTYNPHATNQYGDFTLTRDYTPYIRAYVEKKINEWQKKNEFETTDEYLERVSDKERDKKIRMALNEVCEECIMKVRDKKLDMKLLSYDADHETYLVQTPIGDLIVPVERKNAQEFKQHFPQMKKENTYGISDGKVVVRSVVFSYDDKTMATYSDRDKGLYNQNGIAYQFEPLVISASLYRPGKGNSDVDINIPVSQEINDRTFALVIANEIYKEEQYVKYARNDGNVFSEYMEKTLGIPKKNIKVLNDATINDMRRGIDWLKDAGKAYNGDIKVILYYAGHGVPDESTLEAYLIPSDGGSTSVKTLFPLRELYKEVSEVDSKYTVLFIDACFAGSQRDDRMLSMARGVKLKPDPVTPTRNMIVFSAAQAGETAWGYDKKDHGMFTYFLLKKLQESKGDVSLGELSEYITTRVKQCSFDENNKSQNPNVAASADMEDVWEELRLK